MFHSVIRPNEVEPKGEPILLDGFGLLNADSAGDAVVETTTRRLRRLAVVAAQTGARFVREGIGHDPAAWLLSPRRMFEGRAAVEACQELEGFRRATILHGLSTGLDAEPAQLDALLTDGKPDEAAAFDLDDLAAELLAPPAPGRLFTCLVQGVEGMGDTSVEAFCAMVAPDAETMRRRLRTRYGEELADPAVIHEGFDPGQEGAAFVSEPLARALARAEADPGARRNARLAVHLDLRCDT